MKQVSEVVKTGGLAGQGYSNLLGRPRLGPLPLVLREAVQNSWDARRRTGSGQLRFSVTVRTLNAGEERTFRKIFTQSAAVEPEITNSLHHRLEHSQPIRVLQLADFGTVGLTGMTRPDLPTDGESRFVNFFFDIGRSHETSGDGGTYGFGRSSLYTAGGASLILVDSLAELSAGGAERRVMACRIGESFEVSKGWGRKGRYSGRHFWGRLKHDFVQPVVGNNAAEIATELGMPARGNSAQTGTTILVPWPVDEFNDAEQIVQTLLFHLWPKMVPQGDQLPITFRVEVDGRRHPVPDPRTLDQYRLFVQALGAARTRREGSGAIVVQTLRPRFVTGHLGFAAGITNMSSPPIDDSEDGERTPIPQALNHIALMRPSELVVRYLAVDGTDQSSHSWAGVFICDEDAFVRTAFARAEPPAHDDWIADRLSDRTEKYVVRKTVGSLLPDAIRDRLGLGRTAVTDADSSGASLAATSARFSAAFLLGDGSGAAVDIPAARTSGRRPSRPARGISRPVFSALGLHGKSRIAVFRATVYGSPGDSVVVTAIPSIHAEGPLETIPSGIVAPTIVGWSGGKARANRCEVALELSHTDIEIHVQFHGDYGLTLDCHLEEEDAS